VRDEYAFDAGRGTRMRMTGGDMRRSWRYTAVLLCAAWVTFVAVPAAASGAGATVGAGKGSQAAAQGVMRSTPTTDPVTGWPIPYRYREVAVFDTSQVMWEKIVKGPKQYYDWDMAASASGAWIQEIDPMGTWDTSDDVRTFFNSADSAPSIGRYGAGGRTASMHGSIPGTLTVWYGNMFSGFPDWTIREPDVKRAVVLTVDVDWAATTLIYGSRENSRTAGDGFFQIVRNAGTMYDAEARGRIVGDDGTVWWDGPFTSGMINSFSSHSVSKGAVPVE
jgi:hypothetical protein